MIVKEDVFMDITRLIGETTEYDKKAALEIKKPKSWCKRNSRMMWRKTDNSREELPEYVERSYHEALINGLAHRDYISDNSAKSPSYQSSTPICD